MELLNYDPNGTFIGFQPSFLCNAEEGSGDAGTGGGKDNPGDNPNKDKNPDGDKNTGLTSIHDIPKDLQQKLIDIGMGRGKDSKEKEYARKLEQVGIVTDDDFSKIAEYKKSIETAEDKKREEKGEYEKAKTQLLENHKKEKEIWNGEKQQLEKDIHSLVVENEIIRVANSLDFVKPDQVALLVGNKFKAHKDNGTWKAVPSDETDVTMMDKDMNLMGVDKYLEKFAENNPHFIKSNIGQGGTGSLQHVGKFKRYDDKQKPRTTTEAIGQGLRSGKSKSIVINRNDRLE